MVRLKAGLAAVAKKARHEISQSLRVPAVQTKDCVRNQTFPALASVNKRSSMFVKILRSVRNNLHNNLSSKSVLDDSPLDVSRVNPSRDVLLLP